MTTIWQVRLFNGPVMLDASGTETRRFRSHKVGALLAYLALNLGRSCPREELYEALWPEEDPQVVGNRFRVTLASLRRQMEPPGVAFGSVLDVGEPGRVRLRRETVTCDAGECERLLHAGNGEQAARLVTGPLLPGFYEEWAVSAQARFERLTEELPLSQNLSHAHPGTGTLPLQEAPSAPIHLEPPAAPLHNPSLPLYLTRFFGRERERQTLRELIRAHRLVSLVAMGGIGKTRLVVESIAEGSAESLFVSLVPLPDAERLYDTILQALSVAPQAEASTEAQLVHVLRQRGVLLLVLDNAEHLQDAVAALALALLTEVPHLRLIVTSRHRLNIPGEAVLLLDPLEAPGSSARPERLLEFAAVSLFADRAKNARPDFVLSERNAPAVTEICSKLDGIPLALELAAARITSQTPQQIALSLQDNLTDLKSHQHGLSARHQSLRAVMQGSLALLSEEQRAFFGALSVFQGGWSVEAAAAITGCAEAEEYLDHLTRCSLIVAREDERLEVMRYALLETLRLFAAEHPALEEAAKYRERHARFYMELAEQSDQEDFRFMDRLQADHENLLLAMKWFWKQDRAALMPLLSGILNLWANRGYHRLALEWIARAFPDNAPIAPEHKQGMFRVYVDVGFYEEAEQVVCLARKVAEDPVQITWVYTCLGYVRMKQGLWEEAIACQREAIAATDAIQGDQRGLIVRLVSSNLAAALIGRAEYQPDTPDPAEDYREAEHYLKIGYVDVQEGSRLQSGYFYDLMRALWGQNREEEGDLYFARALEIALSHRHLTTLTRIMGEGAFRLAAKGCPGESVQLLSAAAALQEKMGYRATPYFEARVREQLHSLQTLLGSETFDRNRQSGLYTPLDVLIPSILPKILLRETT